MHLTIVITIAVLLTALVGKGGLAYLDQAFRWLAERNGF